MIIRSQDKKSIFNIENIKSIKAGVLFKSWAGESCDISIGGETIATYSTEEKAIKVLDMIQDAYCRMEDIKCGAVQAQKYDSFCFQMPDDEYVEIGADES